MRLRAVGCTYGTLMYVATFPPRVITPVVVPSLFTVIVGANVAGGTAGVCGSCVTIDCGTAAVTSGV